MILNLLTSHVISDVHFLQIASLSRHQMRIKFLLTFGKLSTRQHLFVDEITTLTSMTVSSASVSSAPYTLPLCMLHQYYTHSLHSLLDEKLSEGDTCLRLPPWFVAPSSPANAA